MIERHATAPPRTQDLWAQSAVLNHVIHDPTLVDRTVALETAAPFVDESEHLSRLVNTSVSAGTPISGWARYREAYSPELVRLMLNTFPPNPAKSIVLDPMCGSGSSQIAAQGLGYTSVGMDVSPYATLLSRTKTSKLEPALLDAIDRWSHELGRASADLTEFDDVDEFLKPYFPTENFLALHWIRRKIDGDFRAVIEVREFLLVALLAIVEACSNRRKDGNGLASRPSRITDPLELFQAQVARMTSESRSSRVVIPSFTRTDSAVRLDSVAAEIMEATELEVGSIIFSPPYPNSFDYFESYKLELLFGRLFDLSTIRARRADLVRSYRQSGSSKPIEGMETLEMYVTEIMDRVPAKELRLGTVDGRSRLLPNMIRGYFDDMRAVIHAGVRTLSPGARMHIVVDQSAYLGVPLPTDLLLAEIGIHAGLEFERLTLCRRARTSAQQLRVNPALGGLLRETVITLRKSL